MNEKVYEDGTKTAKTPIILYYAKSKNSILWIRPWQTEDQCRVNDCWHCMMGNLSGDWFRPFINEELAGFIEKRESDMLPAPFY
jgi:hypothetical protein